MDIADVCFQQGDATSRQTVTLLHEKFSRYIVSLNGEIIGHLYRAIKHQGLTLWCCEENSFHQ